MKRTCNARKKRESVLFSGNMKGRMKAAKMVPLCKKFAEERKKLKRFSFGGLHFIACFTDAVKILACG